MMRMRALLGLAAGLSAIGCSQPSTPTVASPPADRPVARAYPTEFVRPEEGAAIVLIASKPWRPGGATEASAGEETLTAPVHHLRIAPRSEPSWTGAPVEWSVGALIEDELAPGASAVALVPPLPADASMLSIGGGEVRFEPSAKGWPPPLAGARKDPPAPQLVDGELGDPTRAWRVDLAMVLAGETAIDRGGGLAALRRQHAARWQAALARLSAVDAALASRVAGSVARVVRIDGLVAPAWSADLRRVEALLASLLAPDADAGALKLGAEAWLADEPDAVAWVIDDGGEDRPALIGVANLTDAPATASISASGAVELVVVEPCSATQIAIAQPGGSPSVLAETRVGNAVFQLELVTQPIPCAPPGVRMGPLLPQWTMPEWLGERSGGIDGGWATAALLQPRSGGGAGWEVFLDCRAARAGEDSVRLTLGPPADLDGEVRVSRSGKIEGTGVLSGVKGAVREESDRWTATLEIPEAAMARGVVTVGIERLDSRGFRSTWPRRVTPWQRHLPGGEIDLSAWGGLGDRGAEER